MNISDFHSSASNSGTRTGYEWEFLRIPNRLNRKVNVQVRPAEMVRRRQLDSRELGNRCVPEPWEFFKRHK